MAIFPSADRALSWLPLIGVGLLLLAAVSCNWVDEVALPVPSTKLEESSAPPQQTYCNPINIDYGFCPIPDFVQQGKHRTSADPAIVRFRGDYYLFSTNQWGYWWSRDMAAWNFVPRKFLKPQHKVFDELCAPAPFVMDDALHVIGSTQTRDFPIWAPLE